VVCPLYRVANGISVEAEAFFAAHAAARELCVNGTWCVVKRPGMVEVGLDVPTGDATTFPMTVTVVTATGTTLLDETARIQLHRVVFNAACGITALRAVVDVTARGDLTSGA
jgi:hypothetical protein